MAYPHALQISDRISPKTAAFQLALRYKISFSTTRDESKAREIVKAHLLNEEALIYQTNQVKGLESYWSTQSRLAFELSEQGYDRRINDSQVHMENLQLSKTEAVYFQEILDANVVFGVTNGITIILKSQLCNILYSQGKWNESEKFHTQLLEVCLRSFRPDHVGTLGCMKGLARIYCDLGNYENARKNCLDAIKSESKLIGRDHIDTLTTMSFLANIYIGQGVWTDAEEMCLEMLLGRINTLGSDHPITVATVSKLALIFQSQEKVQRAKIMSIEIARLLAKTRGHEHPVTLTAMASLASTYKDCGEVAVIETIVYLLFLPTYSVPISAAKNCWRCSTVM